MIKVEDVSKYYGQHLAVEHVDFEVRERCVVGLLGPNGAGKTTILRILTCYLPPTSGRVIVAGLDSQKEALKIREKIGFMPENVPLYGEMTVTQFLGFVADSKAIGPRYKKQEIGRVVSLCGLERQEKRLIRHLSKGQRQRVGLAQAIIGDPEILILDEPTSGLDPGQVLEIRERIRELGQEKTVILSTHILPEASQVCDEVIIVNNGKVVIKDTLSQLSQRLQESKGIVVSVQTDADLVKMLELKEKDFVQDVVERSPGNYDVTLLPDNENKVRLIKAILGKGINLYEVRSKELSLEEIFVRLVVYGESDHVN